jgi:RimJ/RimL family protein N-acetyltransferase
MTAGGYRVRDLTDADLDEIATWRYDGRWSVYDSDGRLDPDLGYWAVTDAPTGRLVGFGCLGEDARVPGLPAARDVVDVGVGMRPDLVGRGRGAGFASAFLDFAATRTTAARFRVVVKDWNARSLRLVERLGFARTGDHPVGEERYVVLERLVRPG